MSDIRLQETYALARMGVALDRMHAACTAAGKAQAGKWAIAWARLSESHPVLDDPAIYPLSLTSALKKYIESSLKTE